MTACFRVEPQPHDSTRYERSGKRHPTTQVEVDRGIDGKVGDEQSGAARLGDIDRHFRRRSYTDMAAR